MDAIFSLQTGGPIYKATFASDAEALAFLKGMHSMDETPSWYTE